MGDKILRNDMTSLTTSTEAVLGMERTTMSMSELRERARRKPKEEISGEEFRSRFSKLLDNVIPDTVMEYAFFSVPGNLPPWFDTRIELSPGEQVTVFASGRTYLSREADVWVNPDFQLWYRVGEGGEVFRGTRCSHTFSVGNSGRLFLGHYLPGEWTTRNGAPAAPVEAYGNIEGVITALVVRWMVEPREGLKRLLEIDDVASFLSSEIDRLNNPILPPEGWKYLWFLGPAEIFTAGPLSIERPSILCCTNQDTGILQKEALMSLTPDTCLKWSWKVDILPSLVSEEQLPTHDYLSIAVEFDNGQDITYFWSAGLPPETAFRCPIQTWYGRETHVVVRSGLDGLGQWLQEERNLFEDYQRWIGAPPTGIVRVWLIALSLFRRQEGVCEYGEIELRSGDTAIIVN